MDSATLSAVAALAGSVIGGLTSFFSSWLGQSGQFKAQLLINDKGRRQELYREFLVKAADAYLDALTHDKPDLARMVMLYALLSRMRILSSKRVIDQADKLLRLIVDTYPEPIKTFDDLHELVHENAFDPLRSLAEAVHDELQTLA